VRRTIRAAAPDAVEYIGYGLAGYKLDGKPLMYFGAMKKHCGLYGIPAEIDEFAKELKGFEASKGAVRFTPEKPLPATLVTRLVRYRVKKIRQR
jgi:uncharacterized protein YdhG (YjbR/CyaY superfamily)